MESARARLFVPLIATAFATPAQGYRPVSGSDALPNTAATQAKLEMATGKSPVEQMHHSAEIPASAAAPWMEFRTHNAGTWQALWNHHTAVPTRIFGAGIPAPASVASGPAAEFHARWLLHQHLALLAPGAQLDDFDLVSNESFQGTRVVGFVQKHRDYPVIGGQINFRYKNDRLIVIGSDAFPHVRLPPSAANASTEVSRKVSQAAESWIAADATVTRVEAASPLQILPVVRDNAPIDYNLVSRVTVASTTPLGLWDVFIDAHTHTPVARLQKLRFASGQIRYRTPIRYPGDEQFDFPAMFADAQVDGTGVTTDTLGALSWPTQATANVAATVTGPRVRINNQAGPSASTTLALNPEGTAIWDPGADELVEAQLTAFVHAGKAKEFARKLNPNLDWLDAQIPVNVNINESCNAFSDGNSINFFTASLQCENTARLADVVYHEFGHSLHAQSIIPGIGQFDGAFSEGLSDFLAASMTEDPGMGRGFFKNDDPLRHIDPPGTEARWPDDIGGVHTTGLIFAGAMWDLRKLLVERYGDVAGVDLTNRLFYAAVQRASNIPSTYAEIVAEDDDDGDLENGTPNICDINAAFGPHGLRSITGQTVPLAQESALADGYPVQLQVAGVQAQCPGDRISTTTLEWRDARNPDRGGQLVMNQEDATSFSTIIPKQPPSSLIEYRINVAFSDGSNNNFPNNAADPYYQFYVGDLVELYCTDFESNPFDNGWTHGVQTTSESGGADDWQWGAPVGKVGSGDPSQAASGDHVIGNDLGANSDGTYAANTRNYALAPVVDVGNYSDVRVQYWRWLNVEDSFFDSGRIYVNDKVVWTNLDSNMGNSSNTHHRDLEWRFHDVPASPSVRDHLARVRFEIESDGGLEFGGWTIDDFCIVADANSICGDGERSQAEECDNGADNSDSADACRTHCRVATCGDGIVDSVEECDDGNGEDDDECNNDCDDPGFSAAGCGCQSQTLSESATGAALFLGLIMAMRRRRTNSVWPSRSS